MYDEVCKKKKEYKEREMNKIKNDINKIVKESYENKKKYIK